MSQQSDSTEGLCHCIGPQNNQPFCPCMMRDFIELQQISSPLNIDNPSIGCAFDGLNPDKAYALACFCPKCTPRC